MADSLNKKYQFKGTTIDNSFFKTYEDERKFLRDIKKQSREFIEDQDRRKAKSWADSYFRIIY